MFHESHFEFPKLYQKTSGSTNPGFNRKHNIFGYGKKEMDTERRDNRRFTEV